MWTATRWRCSSIARPSIRSTCTWPESGTDTAPVLRTERGYQLLHWRRAGMGYWAITDASADVVEAFANALRD